MGLRRTSAILIALLAAAPLLAQKPTAEELDPVRMRFRDRALAVCVVDLNGAAAVDAETSESVCGCAVGRSMSRWPTGALPRLEGARLPAVMGPDLLTCAGEETPALAAAVGSRLAQTSAAVPPVVAMPTDKPRAPPEADADSSPDFDLGAWLDGLSLPGWLSGSGLPIWVLGPLGLLVLLFLRGLLRRSEESDLLGPPASMRRTPTPPRQS